MIRVLIERLVAEGVEGNLQETMRYLRRQAIHRRGYVSGETLRDRANPRHFVILSTWRAAEDWDAWAASDTRRQIEGRIAAMLAEPERVGVFELA